MSAAASRRYSSIVSGRRSSCSPIRPSSTAWSAARERWAGRSSAARSRNRRHTTPMSSTACRRGRSPIPAAPRPEAAANPARTRDPVLRGRRHRRARLYRDLRPAPEERRQAAGDREADPERHASNRRRMQPPPTAAGTAPAGPTDARPRSQRPGERRRSRRPSCGACTARPARTGPARGAGAVDHDAAGGQALTSGRMSRVSRPLVGPGNAIPLWRKSF